MKRKTKEEEEEYSDKEDEEWGKDDVKEEEIEEEIEERKRSSKKKKIEKEEKTKKKKNKNSTLLHNHSREYHSFDSKSTEEIRKEMLRWFDSHKRDLPWRFEEVRNDSSSLSTLSSQEKNKRAYSIWVSEIMLQQTRVATVIDYFKKWIDKWPTVEDLASATLEEVNSMWSGLGYYRRASFLHKGAKMVSDKLKGKIPDTLKRLKEVPGIGDYTAGAIASIAFGRVTPLVDGNVIRVLSRMRSIPLDIKSKEAINLHWGLAGALVDPLRPGTFNQSLMELGATVCTPKNPNCKACPVSEYCNAFKEHVETEDITLKPLQSLCSICQDDDLVDTPTTSVTKYPVKGAKTKQREETVIVSIIEWKKNAEKPIFLLVQRPSSGLLASLWEFPQTSITAEEMKGLKNNIFDQKRIPLQFEEKQDQYIHSTLGIGEFKMDQRRRIGSHLHIFSHIKQKMHIELISISSKQDDLPQSTPTKWLTFDEFNSFAISSSVRKCYGIYKNN